MGVRPLILYTQVRAVGGTEPTISAVECDALPVNPTHIQAGHLRPGRAQPSYQGGRNLRMLATAAGEDVAGSVGPRPVIWSAP